MSTKSAASSGAASGASHLLVCSVCNGKYFTKTEWSQHLTGEEHQILARENYLKKWKHSSETKCCLVIFSSFPLTSSAPLGPDSRVGVGGGDKIVRFFSKNASTFVSDFVVWKERPCIGVMQFESKKKLEAVINTLGSRRKVLIDNKRVKVKKATHLSDMEWTAILPLVIPKPKRSSSNGNATQTTSANPQVSQKDTDKPKSANVIEGSPDREPVIVISDPQDSSSSWVQTPKATGCKQGDSSSSSLPQQSQQPSVTATNFAEELKTTIIIPTKLGFLRTNITVADLRAAIQLKRKLVEEAKQEKEKDTESTFKKPKPENQSSHDLILTNNCISESLQLQYAKILNSIRIPDEKFNEAFGILTILKGLFSNSDRTAKVVVFRNWYLKLQNPTSGEPEDDLLIFLYKTGTPTDYPFNFTCFTSSEVDKIFLADDKKEFSVLDTGSLQNPPTKSQETQQNIWNLKHNSSGIVFRLFTNDSHLMEAQVCCLLEYLCKFDPRCHPLLTLAYHWTSQNSIQFSTNSTSSGHGDEGSKESEKKDFPGLLILQWLVIFFLSHKKYIPTPTDIQSISQETLIDKSTETDIGFSADLVFANEWKFTNSNIPTVENDEFSDEFIFSVLILFQNFLEFYGNVLKSGGSRGKILDTGNGVVHEINTNDKSKNSGYNNAKEEDDHEAEDFKLYLTHPFIFSWRYLVSKDIQLLLKTMESSGVKLKEFLTVWRRAEAEKNQIGCLESILSDK